MSDFEIHVTVEVDNDNPWRDGAAWFDHCRSTLGIKPIHIMLVPKPGDEEPPAAQHQYMCVWRFKAYNAKEAQQIAHELEAIIGNEWTVLRVKLETPLQQWDVNDNIAYFETHLKCLVSHQQAELMPLLAGEGIHVSESLPGPGNGIRKMYLTERMYHSTSKAKLQSDFYDTFNQYEALVSQIESEVVLWDSNGYLDAGWF